MSLDLYKQSLRKRRRVRIGLAVLVLIVAGIALTVWSLHDVAPLREPPPPEPNGYADLIRAGHAVVGQVPGPRGDIQAASALELRNWVESNHEALTLAEVGLSRECRVTLPVTLKDLQTHLDRASDLRQLCRLLGAAARLAEIEGQGQEVSRYGLDIIRVANKGAKGGLTNDALVGFACESIGQRAIARSREALAAEDCRGLVTALEAIDEQREPVDRVFRRDRAWFSGQYSIFSRAMLAISPRVNRLLQASLGPLERGFQVASARLRLLIAELAIRRYRLEQGSEPSSLEALVPGYLTRVPVDPFSSRAIQYRPANAPGHRLYFLGPDGKDDAGRGLTEKSDWSKAVGDVLVEPAEVSPSPGSAAPPLKTPSARTP
jgi:hypothetical protein